MPTASGLDIAEALDDAFHQVIEMMFGLSVEGPLENEPAEKLSMAGMIGLAGAQFRGLIQITCRDSGARHLAAALLGGEEMLEDPSLVSDSLGELANMLGGAVKQRIDSSGVGVEISLPSVLEGEFDLVGIGAEKTVQQHYRVGGEIIRTSLTYSRGTGQI